MRPSWLPPLQQLDWAIREANNLSTDVTRLWRQARGILSPLMVASEYDAGGPVVHSLVISDDWSVQADTFRAWAAGTPQILYTAGATIETASYTLVTSGWSPGPGYSSTNLNGSFTLTFDSTNGGDSVFDTSGNRPFYGWYDNYTPDPTLDTGWQLRNARRGSSTVLLSWISQGNPAIQFLANSPYHEFYQTAGNIAFLEGEGFTIGTIVSLAQN